MFLKEWILFILSVYYYIHRRIIKPILRLLTKTHELDRIINATAYTDYEKYVSLGIIISLKRIVKYINRSLQLKSFELFINKTQPQEQEEIDELVTKLSKAKQLNPSTSKLLKTLLVKANRVLVSKSEIIDQSNKSITLANDRHKEMLLDIWNHLRPNQPINFVDKQWLSIGFQGSNPLTDFRGSGLLGLKQLHHFVVAEERMKEVYQVATNEKTWYFFAAAGINISGNLIKFITDGNCDGLFFENSFDLMAFTNSFYAELFCGFNVMWIEKKYTDYMRFNSALDDFMKERAMKFYKRIALEYANKQSKIF